MKPALYPRVRGANRVSFDHVHGLRPLPPRARGKRHVYGLPCGGPASTPACAGQTRPVHPGANSLRLYPRVRGANPCGARTATCTWPLPPRARGKLRGSGQSGVAGSLYPRVRGANRICSPDVGLSAPLPPRARGKHPEALGVADDLASTPACAGQTSTACPTACWRPLYPRVRGANANRCLRVWRDQPLPPRARGKRRPPASPTLQVPLYPRVRGANAWDAAERAASEPLPPRARGKRWWCRGCRLPGASTPACAGQTLVDVLPVSLYSLYPRVRGANTWKAFTDPPLAPLPPRARGKREINLRQSGCKPSTPACAGQTITQNTCHK